MASVAHAASFSLKSCGVSFWKDWLCCANVPSACPPSAGFDLAPASTHAFASDLGGLQSEMPIIIVINLSPTWAQSFFTNLSEGKERVYHHNLRHRNGSQNVVWTVFELSKCAMALVVISHNPALLPLVPVAPACAGCPWRRRLAILLWCLHHLPFFLTHAVQSVHIIIKCAITVSLPFLRGAITLMLA